MCSRAVSILVRAALRERCARIVDGCEEPTLTGKKWLSVPYFPAVEKQCESSCARYRMARLVTVGNNGIVLRAKYVLVYMKRSLRICGER